MDRSTLITVYSFTLVILLILSFLFSSSDMAFGSIDLIRFSRDKEENKKKLSYKWALKLSTNYDKTISTILLLNDTVNAGLDAVSTLIGVNLAYIILSPDTVNLASVAETWGLVASIICLVVKIIFGEISAKSIGKIYNFKLSKIYSIPLRILDIIFTPITFVVSGFGKIVTYPVTHNLKDITIIDEDLHNMVDDIEAQGGVDEDQASMLHDAIDYTTTEAYEIMTPRVDIYAIDVDDDINEIIKDSKLFKYSKVPVYEGTIDNIIGYITTKKLMIASFKKEKINLREMLSDPLRFPRSIEINEILKIFKKTKKHFAIIFDEYGGVDGILTMEDILEELVGDIWDEKDDANKLISEKKDGSYIIDGMMTLKDFCDEFNLSYDELDTEYVTIGGFCIELLDDKFARVDDEIEYKNLKIKVIAIDKNNSIEKLLVTPLNIAEEENNKPPIKLLVNKIKENNEEKKM